MENDSVSSKIGYLYNIIENRVCWGEKPGFGGSKSVGSYGFSSCRITKGHALLPNARHAFSTSCLTWKRHGIYLALAWGKKISRNKRFLHFFGLPNFLELVMRWGRDGGKWRVKANTSSSSDRRDRVWTERKQLRGKGGRREGKRRRRRKRCFNHRISN